jgi:hypothetical protein
MNIMSASAPARLSKIAEFWLLSNSERYSLSQAAPEFVILRTPASVRRGPAMLVIDVEGRQEQRSVRVLSADQTRPEYISISRT